MITIILIFSVLNALMTFLLIYAVIKVGNKTARLKNDLKTKFNNFNEMGLS